MKVRNKNENVRYVDCLETAVDKVQQAIDNITYTSYPELNKRTIAKLEEIVHDLEVATNTCLFKP